MMLKPPESSGTNHMFYAHDVKNSTFLAEPRNVFVHFILLVGSPVVTKAKAYTIFNLSSLDTLILLSITLSRLPNFSENASRNRDQPYAHQTCTY